MLQLVKSKLFLVCNFLINLIQFRNLAHVYVHACIFTNIPVCQVIHVPYTVICKIYVIYIYISTKDTSICTKQCHSIPNITTFNETVILNINTFEAGSRFWSIFCPSRCVTVSRQKLTHISIESILNYILCRTYMCLEKNADPTCRSLERKD